MFLSSAGVKSKLIHKQAGKKRASRAVTPSRMWIKDSKDAVLCQQMGFSVGGRKRQLVSFLPLPVFLLSKIDFFLSVFLFPFSVLMDCQRWLADENIVNF